MSYLNRLLVLQVLQQTCNVQPGLTQGDVTSYGVLQCSKGYHGPLCSLCLFNKDLQYGRIGRLECKTCRRKAAIASAYIVNIILVLCFLTFLIHLTLQENKDAAAGLPRVGRASRAHQGEITRLEQSPARHVELHV